MTHKCMRLVWTILTTLGWANKGPLECMPGSVGLSQGKQGSSRISYILIGKSAAELVSLTINQSLPYSQHN
jgi:hypothetical protein